MERLSTKQAIFDHVTTFLLKQNARAQAGSRCLYRLGDLKCAAGCLIPDDLYSSYMEGKRIAFDRDLFKGVFAFHGWGADEVNFVDELQRIHDSRAVTDWPAAFAALAKEHNILRPLKTKQEIYDYVRKHLLGQSAKARCDGECRYRAGSLACAAGCLIPDNLYNRNMEGKLIRRVEFEEVHKYHGWGADEVNFVDELQRIHDSCAIETWEPTLTALAFKEDLCTA